MDPAGSAALSSPTAAPALLSLAGSLQSPYALEPCNSLTLPPPPPELSPAEAAAAQNGHGDDSFTLRGPRPPPLAPVGSPALSTADEEDRLSTGRASTGQASTPDANTPISGTTSAFALAVRSVGGGGGANASPNAFRGMSPLARQVLRTERSASASYAEGVAVSGSSAPAMVGLDADGAVSDGDGAAAAATAGTPRARGGSAGGAPGLPHSASAFLPSSPLRHSASSASIHQGTELAAGTLGAAAAGGLRGRAMTTSGLGPGRQSAFASGPLPSGAGIRPRRSGSPAGGGSPHAGPGGGHLALVAQHLGAEVAPSGGSVTSGLRSPRPPALKPLALPSEKERDEALAAERAAAADQVKIQVRGTCLRWDCCPIPALRTEPGDPATSTHLSPRCRRTHCPPFAPARLTAPPTPPTACTCARTASAPSASRATPRTCRWCTWCWSTWPAGGSPRTRPRHVAGAGGGQGDLRDLQ